MGLDIYKYKVLEPTPKNVESAEYKLILYIDDAPIKADSKKIFNKFRDKITKTTSAYIDTGKVIDMVFKDESEEEREKKKKNIYKVAGGSYSNSFKDYPKDALYTDVTDETEFIDVFEVEGVSKKIVLNSEKIPTVDKEQIVLCLDEISYQRKGMVIDFYKEILNGCWYITEGDGTDRPSMDYVVTKEELERVKKHAEPGTPILEWELGEDELIEFDY